MNGSACRPHRRAAVPPATVALILLAATACVRPAIRSTVEQPGGPDISQLWQEPSDLAARDLFHGSGGPELTPDATMPFVFVAEDRSGYSGGYDVRDLDGMLWSVKLGPEAQSEVVVSRILWAIGYHQPPTYYVPAWSMTGEQGDRQPAGRFRPELPDHEMVGEWSWYENDFVGTRPFKGLVVTNLLVNNWDWKRSNNKIYEIAGTGGPTRQVYVVRDIGASLGKTSFSGLLNWYPFNRMSQGSRNDLEDFESQGFIRRVEGTRVEFEYRGIHGSLLEAITPADVVWTCRLMARLSDQQWRDAFRAAGYAEDHASRFVAKIKSKIAEGLKLERG